MCFLRHSQLWMPWQMVEWRWAFLADLLSGWEPKPCWLVFHFVCSDCACPCLSICGSKVSPVTVVLFGSKHLGIWSFWKHQPQLCLFPKLTRGSKDCGLGGGKTPRINYASDFSSLPSSSLRNLEFWKRNFGCFHLVIRDFWIALNIFRGQHLTNLKN